MLPFSEPCLFCKRMTVEALRSEEGYQHATSYEGLWNVLTCKICRALWPEATTLLARFRAPERVGSGIRLRIEDSKSGSVLRAYMDERVLHAERSGRAQIVYVTAVERDIAEEFGVTCEADRKSSGSEFHMSRTRRWMQDCQETHDCGKLSPKLLSSEIFSSTYAPWPKRLVYVGSEDDTPRLVSAPFPKKWPKYATLSHCWGPSGLPDSSKTTPKSLKEREKSIDTLTLPKTFRDAIEVTRRLGLQYVWIDALCIVQGSTHDWRSEGKRMYEIYSNSIVTLAAESSKDSEGGLFSETVEPDKDLDNPTALTNRLSDGRTSTLIFRASDSRSMKTETAHLRSRAWAQQERVMSPRILHFFDVGILWECRRQYEIWHEPSANVPWYCISHIGAQFGKELMALRNEEYVDFQKEQLLMEQRGYSTLDELQEVRQLIKEKPIKLPRWVLFRPWFRYILPEYTQRKLTFASDKLPAVSSIASALHWQTESEYIAGLWEEDIAFGLAWHPAAKQDRINPPQHTPRPSWTWSSYNFGCQWQVYMRSAAYWEQGIEHTYPTSQIKLLSHRTELAGSLPSDTFTNLFGEVRACELRIRGKAFPGYCLSDEEEEHQEVAMFLKCRDQETRGWIGRGQASSYTWDLQHPVEQVPETMCLLLCTDIELAFLVLEKVEQPNFFERKDMFWFSTRHMAGSTDPRLEDEFEHWMEHGEEQEFVLV